MIRILPFHSLRAFEAVARHGSFSAAAEDLGVSQSAVSQHVKTLETWIGQSLLIRSGRKSIPTREGVQLVQTITEGLGRISDVCEELRDRQRKDNTITISCLPGFAFTWLFPRLMRFDLAHPHLSISIATDTGSLPFTGAEADVGIRYGRTQVSGFASEKLMEERVFPVCSPTLIDQGLNNISDLARHTMLLDETIKDSGVGATWDYWANACNVHLPTPARKRTFGQANMVVQAAIEGLGVALGRGPLVIDALAEGRLVRPFPQIAQSPLSYWLVFRKGVEGSNKITEFRNWVHSEVNSQPDDLLPDV